MSFRIRAPYPTQQTRSLLPSPEFGDSEAITDRVLVKRATDGTTRTYVQTTDDRRKLKWTFRLSRPKALELLEVIRAYHSSPVWITDHRGRHWKGNITNNPFESQAISGALLGRQGLPGERYVATLEFEGVPVQLVYVGPISCDECSECDPAVVEWVPGYTDQQPEVETELALVEIDAATEINAETELATNVAPLVTASAEGELTMPQLDLVNSTSGQAEIDTVQLDASAFLASKDSWVDDLAVCAGSDNNHNAIDLEIDDTAATRKITYVSFDLSSFPATATVVSADVILNVVDRNVAPADPTDITIDAVPASGEGWDEATIKCSDDPGSDGTAQTADIDDTTGDKTIALTGARLTKIQNRLGQSSCSFVVRMATALQTASLQSKDGPGTTSNGPRLRLTLTV
jgi:hypothetical protein